MLLPVPPAVVHMYQVKVLDADPCAKIVNSLTYLAEGEAEKDFKHQDSPRENGRTAMKLTMNLMKKERVKVSKTRISSKTEIPVTPTLP